MGYLNVSTFTKRREAPVAVTAIVAAGATLAIGALPLTGGPRAACTILVLLAAVREISEHWRGAASAAVREDRRRVARDLHDGLAQELAFISGQSKRLAKSFDEEIVTYVGLAAQRALDESRTLVGALSRASDEPLEQAIARAAQDVAVRAGASVELSVEADVKLEREAEDALVRIVREAVTNAVRHGGAENVRVELVHASGLCLRVDDDGRGISDQPVAGFGLASMRQRAEGLGGSFRVLPRPNGGTIVEISLP
jgi:signal transduction histidine kinase